MKEILFILLCQFQYLLSLHSLKFELENIISIYFIIARQNSDLLAYFHLKYRFASIVFYIGCDLTFQFKKITLSHLFKNGPIQKVISNLNRGVNKKHTVYKDSKYNHIKNTTNDTTSGIFTKGKFASDTSLPLHILL